MNYYVIAADGQKYGPADVPTLNQWAQEGRLLTTSMLEDASTGERISATSVPGIMFPMGSPAGQNFQQPNYQQVPRANFGDDGTSDITKVWIFSALSVFCCFGFGIAAVVFANNAQKKGHPQAQTALIVAIICLIVSCGVGGVARGLGAGVFNR
jgi:hypothetical protein